MDKLFSPQSLAIYGLSAKPRNTARIIVDNCLRWGYRGRLFGINPISEETDVAGVSIFRSAADLPLIPDLAVLLIPARYVPAAVEDCGRAGIRRLAIQSGGFNESSDEGRQLAADLLTKAKAYDIRFVGPNGLTVASTESGLCLPFVPSFPVRQGGFSMITQSGGLGLFLWSLLDSEQIGLAKFVSIGNKLDFDEADFLEYLGRDPQTKVIGLYLESISNGRRLVDAARRAGKPVIVFKANTTAAGSRAAMSHTAALATNDKIAEAAFARAGIIRIDRLHDFVTTAKAFELPPMRGRRIMTMSPAGGLCVAMADLCEREGLEFADPGAPFYRELAAITNAGIIKLTNPLDMGDIYQIDKYPLLFNRVLASDQVDGAVFATQWPRMPVGGQDVFTAMFNTDISLETAGAIRASDTPLALVLYGQPATIAAIKEQVPIPIFDSLDEAILALKRQMRYHAERVSGHFLADTVVTRQHEAAAWMSNREGVIGEEALDLLRCYGLASPISFLAQTAEEAGRMAESIGLPVVLKVDSPDAVHKTEVGGVLTGIDSVEAARSAFTQIAENLERFRPNAHLNGIRVTAMAPAGYDLFIGGVQDPAFGPVVLFGMGGIHVEIFQDVERVLCPSSLAEIMMKFKKLRSSAILAGVRGREPIDPEPFAWSVLRVAQLMADFPRIIELDCNPVRLLNQGGLLALDARLRLAPA